MIGQRDVHGRNRSGVFTTAASSQGHGSRARARLNALLLCLDNHMLMVWLETISAAQLGRSCCPASAGHAALRAAARCFHGQLSPHADICEHNESVARSSLAAGAECMASTAIETRGFERGDAQKPGEGPE